MRNPAEPPPAPCTGSASVSKCTASRSNQGGAGQKLTNAGSARLSPPDRGWDRDRSGDQEHTDAACDTRNRRDSPRYDGGMHPVEKMYWLQQTDTGTAARGGRYHRNRYAADLPGESRGPPWYRRTRRPPLANHQHHSPSQKGHKAKQGRYGVHRWYECMRSLKSRFYVLGSRKLFDDSFDVELFHLASMGEDDDLSNKPD